MFAWSPVHRKMWAVPGPVALISSSTCSGGVGGGGPCPCGGGGSFVSLTFSIADAVVRRRGVAPRDRHAVGRRLVDRLRRQHAVEVRVRHVRRRRRRRPARRRRVARDVGVRPAERIGLHAARVVRQREPRALVDVTQRRRACGRRVVLVVRRDVQAEVQRVDRVRRRVAGRRARGRADRRRQVGQRDLDLEVVAAGRAVAVVDGRRVAADPRRRGSDLDTRARSAPRRPSPRAGPVA